MQLTKEEIRDFNLILSNFICLSKNITHIEKAIKIRNKLRKETNALT